MSDSFSKQISQGIPGSIPPMPPDLPGVNHAPARPQILTVEEKKLAVKNALRYFPRGWHSELAPEFARELKEDGRIYMRRFRPAYEMKARPISEYPAKTSKAAAIMLMIQNNLDIAVAQHPQELITYGGNATLRHNRAH